MNHPIEDHQGINTSCGLCVAWGRNLQQGHNKAVGNQSSENLSLPKYRGKQNTKTSLMCTLFIALLIT
jgi:hypothetical protein